MSKIQWDDKVLRLGEDYTVVCRSESGRIIITKEARFIRVTKKGYNFMRYDTNKCIFPNHFYPRQNEIREDGIKIIFVKHKIDIQERRFIGDITFDGFYKYVFKELKLKKWELLWSAPPSECIEETKTIIMSDSFKDNPDCYKAEMFLHEIAHIRTREFNIIHGIKFYKRLSYLINLFSNELGRMK